MTTMAFISLGLPRPCRVCGGATAFGDRAGPVHPHCRWQDDSAGHQTAK